MLTHVERLRVRWVDTDASGRIHYTAAFRYFEIAEWELFRRAGLTFRGPDGDFSLPRVEVKSEFLAALHVDDEIGDVRAITGQVTCVFIGQDQRLVSIPDNVRQALSAM